MNKLLIPILFLANSCYANTNEETNNLSYLETALVKVNKNSRYAKPVILNSQNKRQNNLVPKVNNDFNLLIDSQGERELRYIFEKPYRNNNSLINFGISFKDKAYKNIDFKTRLGLKLNNKINPFIQLTTNKTWKNIYGVDYALGQILKKSVKKKAEYRSYLKLDRKLNDKYSIHNYNESYWQDTEVDYVDINSSLYLKQKLTRKSNLIYKIGLKANDSEGRQEIKNYGINIKYKIAIL
ncbi:hypothetical protein AACT_2423 [Arcobacter acticola]|jgi:hypothetical protein|uniref:DUF481 domain-containing protein n=1 Tax=Arcobacter acticola TaxID=1849015 RepID=A0A6M8EDC5_9BACT|nr:hypothetical protein [Arcobacter acticola]QKE29523.1 hypothetical protein AACT_2423 [Arcobacter acticola]